MRSLVVVMAALLATPIAAFADPAPATKAAPAKPTCVNHVVGKGLDRKVVCEFTADVTVTATAKPKVVVVTQDPRKLVGRPKSSDRLDGLSHSLDQGVGRPSK